MIKKILTLIEKQPTSIALIASLEFLHSASFLFWSLSFLIFTDFRKRLTMELWKMTDNILKGVINNSNFAIENLNTFSEITFQYILILLALVGIASCIFSFFVAYGLLNRRRWAWILALAFEFLNLINNADRLLDILSLELGQDFPLFLVIQQSFHFFISLIIICYLSKKNTRRCFL